MLTVETFGGKMMFLPNCSTNMMCKNNFGGKIIISFLFIYLYNLNLFKYINLNASHKITIILLFYLL